MIIEGDENTGTKDIEVPFFLEKYAGLMFKFTGYTEFNEAIFSSVKNEGLEPCKVFASFRYFSPITLSKLHSFAELLVIPDAQFQVVQKTTTIWNC